MIMSFHVLCFQLNFIHYPLIHLFLCVFVIVNLLLCSRIQVFLSFYLLFNSCLIFFMEWALDSSFACSSQVFSFKFPVYSWLSAKPNETPKLFENTIFLLQFFWRDVQFCLYTSFLSPSSISKSAWWIDCYQPKKDLSVFLSEPHPQYISCDWVHYCQILFWYHLFRCWTFGSLQRTSCFKILSERNWLSIPPQFGILLGMMPYKK